MGETLGLFATVCAFISGSILGSAAFSGYKTSRHKNMMKVLLGSSSIADALSISLESQGMNHRILVYVIELSRRENALPNGLVSLLATNWTSCEKQLRQAGFPQRRSSGTVSIDAFRRNCWCIAGDFLELAYDFNWVDIWGNRRGNCSIKGVEAGGTK